MEKTLALPKSNLAHFLARLREFGTVFAPVRVSDQSYAFKAVDHVEQIAFEALRTILPPKKFLYPQRETIFAYEQNGAIHEPEKTKPFVIFGVHPCDLAGMKFLDKIFMNPPGDALYTERRQQILVIGLSCLPDKHCFCNAMKTDSAQDGYDIFLTDIGDAFFLQVATDRAGELLADEPWVTTAGDSEKQRFKDFWNNRDELFANKFNTNNLPALMDMEWNNPVWEELGNRCLSCGNCTPVCPTCYCFDLVDVAQLNGDGERRREWDSCQFSGFAKVAGEYNFRPGPIDRLKFWYRHKLHGFDDAAAIPGCVGCGRCTVSCPAGIDDIVGVVLRLEGTPVHLEVEKKGDANESG